MFYFFLKRKRVRWGREHLVDLERSEQIYLVIRDHIISLSAKCTTDTALKPPHLNTRLIGY